MRKIFLSLWAFLAAAAFLTCDRSGIFESTNSGLLSVVGGDKTPAPPSRIYIYSAGLHGGNLGGRNGANNLCRTAAPGSLSGLTIRALIMVSVTDTMPNLVPSAYHTGIPVYDGTGTNVISADWAGLWDSMIDMTIGAAGIIGPGLEWWSGANPAGDYIGQDCLGWTSPMTMDTGMRGNSNFTGSQWVNWNSAGCSANNYLLCVAY